MRTPINDRETLRELNAALLDGLQLNLKENESMFGKKQKAAPQTIGDIRKAAAEKIEKAIFEARGVVPRVAEQRFGPAAAIDSRGGPPAELSSFSPPFA